jgi:hypothetical protein
MSVNYTKYMRFDIKYYIYITYMTFTCERCEYTTKIKCNFEKHNKSNHIKRMEGFVRIKNTTIATHTTPLTTCINIQTR